MGTDFNFLCYPNNYTLTVFQRQNGTYKKTKKLPKGLQMAILKSQKKGNNKKKGKK